MYEHYFTQRQVAPHFDPQAPLPAYWRAVLPPDRQARLLDIGCGFGQTLAALRAAGYVNAYGVDISPEAASFCQAHKFAVERISSLKEFCLSAPPRYAFIVMSHVLEHLEKPVIIEHLQLIREKLLQPGAPLLVVVPNAQANTGCYWAYEDFTHHTLFTSGSLYFVLKAAGFAHVELLDIDCLADTRWWLRPVKRLLLGWYKTKIAFWNRVTNSAFHAPSPVIFSYEIKALAR